MSSCIQTVAGEIPAGVVTLTKSEVKKARALIRGVWGIPGKGIYHIYEDGQAVRLHLTRCSFYQQNEGSVCFETEDRSVSCSADVRWSISGKRVRIHPATWAAWSAADRAVFARSAVEAGLQILVARNWFLIVSMVAVVLFWAFVIWVALGVPILKDIS